MQAEAEPVPALRPATISRELRSHHLDENRLFQLTPTLARAPGGRLWAAWCSGGEGEGSDNFVLLATSDDNGSTWSKPRFVVDLDGPERIADQCLWLDSSGRLWLFYTQTYKWWDGRAGVWTFVTNNPDQPYPDWEGPRRISDGILLTKPLVLRRGDWLLPVAYWNHVPHGFPANDARRHVPADINQFDPQRVGQHVLRSGDEGRTFEVIGAARIKNVRFDEPMFIERPEGDIWMLVRTRGGIGRAVSQDYGRTWKEDDGVFIPNADSRFFIRKLVSGRLLLIKHNPDLDTIWLHHMHNPVPVREYWRMRSHLTAYLSDDDGDTWHGGLLLDERVPVSYPDGDQAPDGTIFITYDFDRHGEREILMARFTEEDIVARRLQSEGARPKILINKATGMAKR
jgi:predicted neuraminidase